MRYLLLLLAFVAGCGCTTCVNVMLEMNFSELRPLCVDEFATDIKNNCWVRKC